MALTDFEIQSLGSTCNGYVDIAVMIFTKVAMTSMILLMVTMTLMTAKMTMTFMIVLVVTMALTIAIKVLMTLMLLFLQWR